MAEVEAVAAAEATENADEKKLEAAEAAGDVDLAKKLTATVEADGAAATQAEQAASLEVAQETEPTTPPRPQLKDNVKGKHLAEELFAIIDTDSSGDIDKDEMLKAHKVLKTALPGMFKDGDDLTAPDTDKDGKVDLKEWLNHINLIHMAVGPKVFVDITVAGSYALRTAFGGGTGTDAELDKLTREFFDAYCAGGDDGSVVTKERFPALVSAMGMELSVEEVGKIWDEADADKKGTIDFVAFAEIIKRNYKFKEQAEVVSQLYDAFQAFDLDGDGFVTLSEMRKVMMEMGSNPLSAEEWSSYEAFFKRADAKGSGQLTVIEYIKASLAETSSQV